MSNVRKIVTVSDVNQNFSKIARLVDGESSVVVVKHNKPKYVIIGYDEFAGKSRNEEKSMEGIEKMFYYNIDALLELSY